MTDTPTTTQLPPSNVGEIVSTWVSSLDGVHRRIFKVLQDPRVRANMPPMMRDLIDDLVSELRNCRVHTPTPAMVRGWVRTLGPAAEELAMGSFD